MELCCSASWIYFICKTRPSKSGGGANADLVLSIALVWSLWKHGGYGGHSSTSSGVGERYFILELAEDVEAEPADPEQVACKAEDFIEIIVISALSDQDIDRRVPANLE